MLRILMGYLKRLPLASPFHYWPIRRATLLLCATCLYALLSTPALANTAPSNDRPALRALAKQFSEKLGKKLDETNSALDGSATILSARQKQSYDAIPDEELLLLIPSLTSFTDPLSSFRGEEPITAIKRGYHAYISLTDFSYLAGFDFKTDIESQKVTGWFMTEGNAFNLNLKEHKVTLGEKTLPVPADALIVENDDIYVQESALAEWFNFTSDIQMQAQRINITTYTQLPLQERIARQKKRSGIKTSQRPEKPRHEHAHYSVTTPRADVLLTQKVQSRGDGSEPNNYSRYNVLTSNQLLDHEMTSFVSGTLASNKDGDPLEQVRINFRKESENNDLLGPLRAKVYQFNDLTPVVIEGTGGASTERGFRVSNHSDRYTVNTTTQIEGDAQPNWDIELYRNDVFVAGTTSDETGRYTFEGVPLFAGDNKFKIMLFGPQGEKREEDKIVTVLPGLIGDIKGYYDLSLTQKDTITYRSQEIDREDTGTPRLVASYDRRVNDALTLRGGVHSREYGTQRDNYFYSGAVLGINNTIVNADLITTSDGPFKVKAQARRNIGRHSGLAGAEYLSADFSESFIDETTDMKQNHSAFANITGPFMTDVFYNVSYDAGSRITQFEDGHLTTASNAGLYSYYKGMRFRNELELLTSRVSDSNGTDENELIYKAGISGRHKGYYWRGNLSYQVVPEGTPEEARIDVDKNFNSRLSGFAGGRHLFEAGVTELNTGLTYYADKARISPSIVYDTEQNAEARLDVSFSLAKTPTNDGLIVSNRPMTSQAELTVFSFLDKDGDGLYGGDDEPLPDVIISAKQYGIDLLTNKDGLASNAHIPTSRISDVIMEESSTFDPTWVSGYEGVSIFLKPTESARLEFPVLRGAEIDGTASYKNSGEANLAAKSQYIALVTPDGATTQSTLTAFDGFYILSKIRPGIYYLTTNSSQSPVSAYRVPEKLVITPEGAQIYGKNITLTRGYNIPFHFSAANANPALERRTKILKPEDIAREDVYIRLGNYRSSLAASLAWYKLKLQTRGWNNKLSPTEKDFDTVARDEKTGRLPLMLKPAQPLRIEEAALLCERLVDAGFSECGVDVVTTYYDGQEAAATDTPPVKG